MAVNLEDVVKLAEQLNPEQQNLLIYRLRVKQGKDQSREQSPSENEYPPDEWSLKRGSEYVDFYRDPTREELIEELNNLHAAGAFKNVESLYGKYANPNVLEMTEEELHAQLHAIATEWEQELDDPDAG
jgi:hypothetical protein